MSVLLKISNGIDTVNKAIGKLFAWILLPMICLTAIEVFRRYVLNSPTIWAWELIIQMWGLMLMACGGYCYWKGGFVRVDVAYTHFPMKVKYLIGAITAILAMVCMALVYTPVRYYENGEPFMTGDTGFQVLVTQFTTEERGGETGDFYYDLTLTEYRDYSPSQVDISSSAFPGAATGSVSKPRSTPEGQITVGSVCTASGRYYASSYGDEPHGNGNGRRCVVSRIISDPSRPYPIHITTESGGWLGWLKKSQLRVVG